MRGQRVGVAVWAMAVFDAGQKQLLKRNGELTSCKNRKLACINI